MELTDTEKAKSALLLLGIVFFSELGLTLLTSLTGFIGVHGTQLYAVQSVLWACATGGLIAGALMLSRALAKPDLVMALVGACGLMLCFELFWAYQMFNVESGFHAPQVVSFVSMAVGLGVTLGFCVLIGKLGRTTGFAAVIGALAAMRSLMMVAFLVAVSADRPMWIYSVRTLVTLVISGGMGALALHARGVLQPAAAGPLGGVPAGSTVVAPEASGGRLIATGLVLLVLGIGATALSFSAASSGSGGGRYVIATGAIASGLVQLFRGLGRLGKGD